MCFVKTVIENAMPTKERYERHKEYYFNYHRTDAHKEANRVYRKKLKSEGRCIRCGHKLVDGASAATVCINCSDNAALAKTLSRGGF